MESSTKFAITAIIGAIIFFGSLALPWESWHGLPLTYGSEVVSMAPLPYMLPIGVLISVGLAVLILLKIIGDRLKKLLALIGGLLVFVGWIWSLFKMYELVVDFGWIGRGLLVGSVGALAVVVSVGGMAKR